MGHFEFGTIPSGIVGPNPWQIFRRATIQMKGPILGEPNMQTMYWFWWRNIYHQPLWGKNLCWWWCLKIDCRFHWQPTVTVAWAPGMFSQIDSNCLNLFFLIWMVPHASCSWFWTSGIWGMMPFRPVGPDTRKHWKDLAQIFVRLLGGSASSQQASAYLTSLADCTLPADEPPALVWHEQNGPVHVMPQAREEPHPVVLATLCPSVPLRAVWKRRWYSLKGLDACFQISPPIAPKEPPRDGRKEC